MANSRKLVEVSIDKLDLVFFEIRKAINEVTMQCGMDDSKLKIAIPKYFCDCIKNSYLKPIQNTPFQNENEKDFMFGIEVIPNYDNFIVVFHEDMPMFLDTNYKVIDLK